MKIPNKKQLKQIALNHSSYVDFKGFMKIYKKCTAKPYSFLVNDTTLQSYNPFRFKKNLSKYTCNKTLTIDDQNEDEKLRYDINTEAPKISVSWSGKINNYEYLTGEEILPCNDKKKKIEQATFTYSLLGKAFEKQIKTNEDQGEKQIKAIQNQGQIKAIKKYAYSNEDSLKVR